MALYNPYYGQTFASLSELKLQVGSDGCIVFLVGITSLTDGNGANYRWDASSTATPDDFFTVQVTGMSTGRWLRMINTNVAKGTQVLNGTVLVTSYVINHNLGVVPAFIMIQALSANAAALSYIDDALTTSTQFTVKFLTVPVLGTNNLKIGWLAIKF